VIVLRDKATGATVGSISDQHLQFLIDHLEEESAGDTDYYLNRVTLETLAQQGADPQLVDVLRRALGDREDMDIEWSTA
jgi:processive 1,2-diacylglycerol beta-glucosyltransferase